MVRTRKFFLWVMLLGSLLHAAPDRLAAQFEIEREPIHYSTTPTKERVATLQAKLDAGELKLLFDPQLGYLPALLKQLEINPSSQMLVYSKTSLQLRRISPQTPRAIYFNDDAYVGWVPDGDVLEIMTTDPVQGPIFYTLEQTERPALKFTRDKGQCLTCHETSRTQNVPGGVVRSVFVDRSGQPEYGSGTFTTDQRSPFEQRWGGWYVTGTHGSMRHMGNLISHNQRNPEQTDRDLGANLTKLDDKFNADRYLTNHSDIVALMVLEHQTQMQNFLTLASYETRTAIHYDQVMNAALDRSPDHESESTARRVISVGDKLLNYLLFVDEFRLEDPVAGTSSFAKDFAARGIRDKQGRSLRDFDLKTRLFRYPCSYLIYSPSFQQLPLPVKKYVLSQLREILTGQTDRKEFAHLSVDDRAAILEILNETLPELWTCLEVDRQ